MLYAIIRGARTEGLPAPSHHRTNLNETYFTHTLVYNIMLNDNSAPKKRTKQPELAGTQGKRKARLPVKVRSYLIAGHLDKVARKERVLTLVGVAVGVRKLRVPVLLALVPLP